MAEEKKKSAEEQEQEQGKGAGSGGNGTGGQADKGGGDLSKALKEAREEKKQQKQENEQLRQQLKELQQRDNTSEAAGELDLSDYKITDDDLMDGDAEKVNEKLRGAIQSVYRKAQEDIKSQLKNKETESTVDKIMGEFSIFQDEDEELRSDASAAAVEAVKNLPDGYSPDDLRNTLKGVAQRFSKYKVAREGGEGGGEGEGGEEENEPPPSPADSGASHMDQDKRPETWDEAENLGDKIVSRFRKKQSQQ